MPLRVLFADVHRSLLGGLRRGSLKNACDYRFELGSNSEDLPVVLRLIEPASDSMGRSAVYDIVKAVMRETADRLRKEALELAGMAAQSKGHQFTGCDAPPAYIKATGSI